MIIGYILNQLGVPGPHCRQYTTMSFGELIMEVGRETFLI